MVMDLAASAIMAVEVLEDNLPKPLMLSGNFHYVCVLLSMVEINVVVVPPHPTEVGQALLQRHEAYMRRHEVRLRCCVCIYMPLAGGSDVGSSF